MSNAFLTCPAGSLAMQTIANESRECSWGQAFIACKMVLNFPSSAVARLQKVGQKDFTVDDVLNTTGPHMFNDLYWQRAPPSFFTRSDVVEVSVYSNSQSFNASPSLQIENIVIKRAMVHQYRSVWVWDFKDKQGQLWR